MVDHCVDEWSNVATVRVVRMAVRTAPVRAQIRVTLMRAMTFLWLSWAVRDVAGDRMTRRTVTDRQREGRRERLRKRRRRRAAVVEAVAAPAGGKHHHSRVHSSRRVRGAVKGDGHNWRRKMKRRRRSRVDAMGWITRPRTVTLISCCRQRGPGPAGLLPMAVRRWRPRQRPLAVDGERICAGEAMRTSRGMAQEGRVTAEVAVVVMIRKRRSSRQRTSLSGGDSSGRGTATSPIRVSKWRRQRPRLRGAREGVG